jgi:hypothetical protein
VKCSASTVLNTSLACHIAAGPKLNLGLARLGNQTRDIVAG